MASEQKTPFSTATMARIFLDQGRLDQAEAIYRDLLARRPGDELLEQGLAEVERRRQADIAPDLPDHVRLAVEGGTLCCSWEVSDRGRQRAELVAGSSGAIVLRISGFPSDPDRTSTDTEVAEAGELSLPLPPQAQLLAAAVGLRTAEGQFVSIAHSGIIQAR